MLKLFANVFADSGQKFAQSDRHDPYRNFNYTVTITGKKIFAKAGFQKITGLKVKTDVIEYREGADAQLNPHKLPGLVKFDPVTFERGMSEDTDMWDWILQQVNSDDAGHKCTITIELKDRNRKGAKKWEMRECWISDYETGDFDAQGNGIMLDRMIIQHEGLKLDRGTASASTPTNTLQ
jgi:phage tail-like protein